VRPARSAVPCPRRPNAVLFIAQGGVMKAWRVHDFGEPQDQLALDEIPEPTGAALAGLSMGLGGWIPCGPRARAL
jgi:hypothetical protein